MAPTILFDKFEILDTLKKDQHTTVYLANHIYLGKKIILKTLSTEELSDKTFLDRFKREAKILAQIEHPNIIKVLDFGISGNSFYISTEYFESSDLRKIIKENNLSDADKINLCINLFKALNAAHQRGIIHRDIKPENILINKKLELKIADFGLALIRDDIVLTHKSSIVGTPGYMSPEQIRGEELNVQTDLFSSGIVIYELFTNNNPLIGKDISETINNILNFKVEKDFIRISTLPLNVQEVLKDLLRKNFSKRIKTALDALKYFNLDDQAVGDEYHLPVKKKSKTGFIYLAVALLLVVIAVFVINKNLISPQNHQALIEKNKQELPVERKTEDGSLIINEPVKRPLVNPTDIKEDEPVNDEVTKPETKLLRGKLFVEANPWAEVYIENKKVDTTPMINEIELESGVYRIRLFHPDFPEYSEVVEIQPGELLTVKIDFNEKVGFLDCKIFPWGEIYINENYNNTTPLRKPIMLMPGRYNLKISNPNYKSIDEEIIIKAKETLILRYNFDDMN